MIGQVVQDIGCFDVFDVFRWLNFDYRFTMEQSMGSWPGLHDYLTKCQDVFMSKPTELKTETNPFVYKTQAEKAAGNQTGGRLQRYQVNVVTNPRRNAKTGHLVRASDYRKWASELLYLNSFVNHFSPLHTCMGYLSYN